MRIITACGDVCAHACEGTCVAFTASWLSLGGSGVVWCSESAGSQVGMPSMGTAGCGDRRGAAVSLIDGQSR